MSSEKANQTFTEEHMPIIIPIVSLIAIFMFLGVIGNAAVIYIYGSVLKKSTVHYFITVLAVFDFVCCLLGLPLEFTEFYYAMAYPSNGLCKWQRFLTFWCSIGSVSVLLLISIERYRKVCWPANYQINLRHAKYFALGGGLVSMLLASPMAVLTSNNEIQLDRNRTGCDCSLSSGYGIWPRVYLTVLLVFTTVTLAAMLILYSLLWRTARKHFLRSDSIYKQNVNHEKTGSSPARRHLSRTNRTVLSITVLFIISFFPTLLLNIFADRLLSNMNYSEMLVFFMVKRLYILNSSFNPLAYGFCNKHFRNSLIGPFRRICGPSSPEIESTSTETS